MTRWKWPNKRKSKGWWPSPDGHFPAFRELGGPQAAIDPKRNIAQQFLCGSFRPIVVDCLSLQEIVRKDGLFVGQAI